MQPLAVLIQGLAPVPSGRGIRSAAFGEAGAPAAVELQPLKGFIDPSVDLITGGETLEAGAAGVDDIGRPNVSPRPPRLVNQFLGVGPPALGVLPEITCCDPGSALLDTQPRLRNVSGYRHLLRQALNLDYS